MTLDAAASRQFALIAKAIAFIRARGPLEPTLEEIAAAVPLSAQQLERVLADWAGISPKCFVHYLSRDYLRQQLAASADVLTVDDVATLTSLNNASHNDELRLSYETMTPDQVKAAARGIDIGYGFGPTPFGDALVAWTPRGICHLAFSAGEAEAEAVLLGELAALWPAASLERDDKRAHDQLQGIFSPTPTHDGVHVVLRGTNFQLRIWAALIRLEPGQIVSYGQLARALHAPKSSRAVGSAIAANTVGFLIPCHRMIRAGGAFGEYRWGNERKQAMIVWEAHRRWVRGQNLPSSAADTPTVPVDDCPVQG